MITNGKKYQIVNINLNDIDDDFAKVLTKIYSRLIFDFAKALKDRGSIPFHIILEEAHRYIQSDQDRFLFGYNIFERISKEGRKYGVILGIITQRPVELSDNVISQCTNFLIFKINHPLDVEYIRKMVPNITDEIVEKQKSLQSGTCLGFGLGFKIPLIIKMEMPDPAPLSGNCDVVRIWSSAPSGAASSNESSAQGMTATASSAPSQGPNGFVSSTTSQIPNGPIVSEASQQQIQNGPIVSEVPQQQIQNGPAMNVSVTPEPVMSQPVNDSSQNSNGNNMVGEKFDDSFVITDKSVISATQAPVGNTTNEEPVMSTPLIEITNNPKPVLQSTHPLGISEIAEVNINSQGMLQTPEKVVPPPNDNGPLIEIDDDDDDDLGPDFG